MAASSDADAAACAGAAGLLSISVASRSIVGPGRCRPRLPGGAEKGLSLDIVEFLGDSPRRNTILAANVGRARRNFLPSGGDDKIDQRRLLGPRRDRDPLCACCRERLGHRARQAIMEGRDRPVAYPGGVGAANIDLGAAT